MKITAFDQIRTNYTTSHNTYRADLAANEQRIEQRRAQIERLEAKRSRIYASAPHWTTDLLRPVLDAVKEHFPNYYFDDDRLNTFGLRAECPVGIYDRPDFEQCFREGHGPVAYLTFTPGDLTNGELRLDTGRQRDGRTFAPGTLGDINGMNNETVLVTSIEQIVAHIKEQEGERQ